MSDIKPPVTVELTWDGDLRFAGRTGDRVLMIDSAAQAGPSPMQALAFALAGCMAVDIVHILAKGRQTLAGLQVRLQGERAGHEPRRFERITLHVAAQGDVDRVHLERAIALSRDKYCSVWHTLRRDIDFSLSYEVVSASSAER